MLIYEGGSDKDTTLGGFTGNDGLYTTTLSSKNQMFISFTSNNNEAFGKGFSASFTFGKKVTNLMYLNS